MRPVDLQTAACGRPSPDVVAAVKRHLDVEVELGGYAAEAAAAPALDALRADLGALVGTDPDGVALTVGASQALRLLLDAWPLPERARVAVAPSEWGPVLDTLRHRGHEPVPLPVDGDGLVDPDALAALLATWPPDLVHLTVVPSHRGLVQPVAAVRDVCRAAGVSLWVDAAQALGHVALLGGLDAVYAPSRKWLCGPRGSGVVAVAPEHRDRLDVHVPTHLEMPRVRAFEGGENAVAVRVGFGVAVAEHRAAGPARVAARLADVGDAVRAAVADVAGWTVVDAPGARCAIVGLRPTAGQDAAAVRDRLEAEHGVRASVCLPWRAPGEIDVPLLRFAPRADVTDEEIERAVAALALVGR